MTIRASDGSAIVSAEAPGQWAARFTRSVADEIQRHRKQRGWSAQKLADECAALGLDISRAVLANLESGRRAILDVAELLVIARALGVAPAELLAMHGQDGPVEIAPGTLMTPEQAAAWLCGSIEPPLLLAAVRLKVTELARLVGAQHLAPPKGLTCNECSRVDAP